MFKIIFSHLFQNDTNRTCNNAFANTTDDTTSNQNILHDLFLYVEASTKYKSSIWTVVNLNSLEPKDRFLTDKARDERENVDLFEFGFKSSFCLKIFLNVMARKNISRESFCSFWSTICFCFGFLWNDGSECIFVYFHLNIL